MKKAIMIGLILALLVVSSCNKQNNTPTHTPFVGGTKAVDMSFVDGAPPDEIFAGAQGFSIMVQLKNVGESPANGFIELIGLSPKDIGLQSSGDLKKSFTLRGSSKTGDNVLEGETRTIGWSNLRFSKNFAISGSMNLNFQVKSCYTYNTTAVVMACISNDPYDTSTDKVCKVNEAKQVSNSGAPVKVVEAKEVSSGENNGEYSYLLTLKIKNVGSGKVFDVNDEECDWGVSGFDKQNKVRVSIKPNSQGVKVECFNNGDNTVLLSKGSSNAGEEATLMCTIKANTTTTFVAPIQIDLSYKYSNLISKTVAISATPGK